MVAAALSVAVETKLKTEAPEALSGDGNNLQRNDGDGDKDENAEHKEEASSDSDLERPHLDDVVVEPAPGTNLGSAGSGSGVSITIEVPNNKVGVLIGKGGATVKSLESQSGAKIRITKDADVDPRAPTRPVKLIATTTSVRKAQELITDVIAEEDAGGSPLLVAKGLSTAVQAAHVTIQVSNEKVDLLTWNDGETVKDLQTRSGTRIQLVPQHFPPDVQSKERAFRVSGDAKQIEMARVMIQEVISQPVRPPLSVSGNRLPALDSLLHTWCVRNYRPSGPIQPQGPQYPTPKSGGYLQQAPHFGPSFVQRPPASFNTAPQQEPPQSPGHPQPTCAHPGGYGPQKQSGQPGSKRPPELEDAD